MLNIGWMEIGVILVAILLLFGPKRIPELARALGRAKSEFKKAQESIREEGKEIIDAAEKAADDDSVPPADASRK